MSICCLNPLCDRPLNQDNSKFCHNCRTLIALLRNQYRPIRFLGSGGFGRTFLAENIDKFNEQCVIKQLVPQVQGTWATQKAKELFEQEAKKLQKLGEHPQIPSLTAYFEQDNYWYIVQQFVEGQTLYQELEQKGVFAEEQIRKVLQELLEILKFIHQSPVIHRDLKPENVMRRHSDRKLVLIDFGIAKELAQTTLNPKSKNALGTSIGSFGYSPLEQLQGGEAYPASDLYSLGTICFHLLSGIHPFQLWQEYGYGWTADWQKQIKTPISQSLVRILTKLLQKDYQQRYQNVEQVLADLNLKIPDSTLISPAPFTQIKKNQPNAKNQVPANQNSSQTKQNLPITVVNKVNQHSSPSLSERPEKPSPAQKKKKIPGWLLFPMLILLGSGGGIVGYQKLQTINSSTDPESIFTPQNVRLYTQKPENINYSEPISTQTLSGTDIVRSIAISPDGKTIVSGSMDDTIKIWDLATGELQSTLTGHKNIVNSVAISPDGKTIVSGSWDHTIKIWDLATGELQSTLTGHKNMVNSVAISPDGKTIVSGEVFNTIKIWDFATRELQSTLTGHEASVESVAISADGKTIVSSSLDKTIKIWDKETRKLQSTLTGENDDYINSVAISPDGKTIVSVSGQDSIEIWDRETGELRSTLTEEEKDYVNSVAISPDGKTIFSDSRDTIKIWDKETRKLQFTLTREKKDIGLITISPDGKTIVGVSGDNTMEILKFQ
ncbi:MAG: protein kinase domain-containing protein [Waterburya sp.]